MMNTKEIEYVISNYITDCDSLETYQPKISVLDNSMKVSSNSDNAGYMPFEIFLSNSYKNRLSVIRHRFFNRVSEVLKKGRLCAWSVHENISCSQIAGACYENNLKMLSVNETDPARAINRSLVTISDKEYNGITIDFDSVAAVYITYSSINSLFETWRFEYKSGLSVLVKLSMK